MTTIVTRAGKGSPLTNTEVDSNFSNLNTDKLELGGTFSSGTANSILYLNGSKVLTTGSALTYNGTTLTADTASTSAANIRIENGSFNRVGAFQLTSNGVQFDAFDQNSTSAQRSFMWLSGGSEQMRLTSTGLGIGTSSPGYKLDVNGAINIAAGNFFRSGSNPLVASNGSTLNYQYAGTTALAWRNQADTTELMRLDSTGLGIGTSSPIVPLHVVTTGTSTTMGGNVIATFRSGTAGRAATVQLSDSTNSNYLSSLNGALGFGYGGTEYMRLDSSGNLGLGVTPSAWASGYKVFQIGNSATSVSALFSNGTNDFWSVSNAYFDGTNFKYVNSGTATGYEQLNGAHYWSTAASGTAGNAITFSQAMTLDASGRLFVGSTTAPASGEIKQLLQNAGGTYLEFQNSSTNSGATIGTGGGDLRIYTNSGATGSETYTERARITSGGTFQTQLDAEIYGVTVGRGAGAVSSNTAVGANALVANTTGVRNTVVGAAAGATMSIADSVTAVGYGALNANTGSGNTGVGEYALQANSSGASNTSLGYRSLYSNTTADNNTAVGYQAGYSNTTGAFNLFVGRLAGYSNTTADAVTAVGNGAAYANTTGTDTTAVGSNALVSNTTGGYNTALGSQSLYSNTTASNNTAVGYQAGYNNTTGGSNTLFGYQAGNNNTTGGANVYIGFQVTSNSAGATGVYNSIIGTQAGFNITSGGYNSALGQATLYYLTTGSNNVAVGGAALFYNTTASNNTAVGYQAGYSNTTGAQNNYFGRLAGYTNATGDFNNSFGESSLYYNTGSYNTAMGGYALSNNTTASNNTAVGYQAGYSNTTGALTAFGSQAGYANTTGRNTALGLNAGQNTTTGTYNTAVGDNALLTNVSGSYNVALGFQAVNKSTGDFNTGLGTQALFNNTTASNNTAVGYQAMYSNQTGTSNVAVGHTALYANTGSSNTAVGIEAMVDNTSGGDNSAFGQVALGDNTTGSYNVAVGKQALRSNTTASYNTAVGYQAAYSNTTGVNNQAFGDRALYSNSTGNNNVAIGQNALYSSTASENIAIGLAVGYLNTTGAGNTGIGVTSLRYNTTGSSNTTLGYQTLYSNTTASNNTAVGYQAGYSNTTGAGNTFFGNQAGYAVTTSNGQTFIGSGAGAAKTTGGNNTFVGSSAGGSATTGTGNTFIGVNDSTNGAGYAVTTGSKNTIIGGYTGNQGGLDIRTADNYIVLSDGDGNPRMYANGAAWTNPGSMNVGGMTTYASYSQSFSLGTTQWIRLCQLGNPGTMRIKYFLGSSNSEEYGEVLINETYNSSGNQITVNRQSYNSHLLEVRLVAAGGSGYPYDVFFNIRSDQFAPNITWTPFDVRASSFTIYNDTTSPGAASSSLVLETGSGTSSNIVATNGLYGAYGGGVQFPATQSASSNANTLDDYEEGTWTPTDASGASLTFSQAEGLYTKVGNVVFFSFNLIYPTTSNSSAAAIGGLPFVTRSSGLINPASSFLTYTNTNQNLQLPFGQGAVVGNFYLPGGGTVSNATLSAGVVRMSGIIYT